MVKLKGNKLNLGKLNSIYELISEERKIVAKDLIIELKFISETLDRLKVLIRNGDVIEQFEQGKQSFIRENPALKSYNTTIQRYSLIYKQLVDLIPKIEAKIEDDGFDDFVNRRNG